MAKLVINVPGAPTSEIELKPGANRFGRSLNTDIQISHPSVSSVHCEIVDTDGALVVKDLGSTNGTFLDGQPVQEGSLQPGQTLRLGEVEISFAPEFPAKPALRMAPVEAPAPPLPPAPRLVAALPVRRNVNFYKSISGAFVFPFRRNGLILLVSGTVFFVIINLLSGAAGIVGGGLGIFSCGYLFGFLQSIITTSALGETDMPGWPEFDDWLENCLEFFLQLVGIFVVCLGPAIAYSVFVTNVQVWLAAALWIAGLLYLPMALLAVSMYDSLMALNPMLIVLSILRVPLEYAASCSVLGLLLLILSGSNWLDKNLKTPLLPSIVDEFLLLYTLTVMARLAGLLFYTTKHRLGWAMSGI
jgi:pSer/pThr/pTyr-binding forkhead associated (FHA) protein